MLVSTPQPPSLSHFITNIYLFYFFYFSLYFRTKLSNIKSAVPPSSNNSIQTANPIKEDSTNIDIVVFIFVLVDIYFV